MAMKRKPVFPSLFLLAVTIALLFCSKDYNPYADLTNAKVHVISLSFADNDTVPLYSKGVIKLVVALHEEVDSFVVRAPGNRFWSKMKVPAVGTALNGGPYLLSVSFYDTGSQEILVETHRSNGEVVPQVFPLYVTNGLHQADIGNYFGKPFTLSTPRVADSDVLYHWDFGPGRRDSSLASTFSKTFYYFTPSCDTGFLWVTDLEGKNGTPGSRFIYSFKDTSKPVITCKNNGVLSGDTLSTGDTTLVFKVEITDAGTDRLDSCSVNGKRFETENSLDHSYTKIFNNLPALTRDAPLKLVVFARDNPDSPNVSIRTFWVKFLAGGVKNSLAEVQILIPPKPNSVVGSRNYTITGQVKSYFAPPRTLTLSLRVNGSLVSPVPKKFSDSGGYWEWPVYLGLVSNTIVAKIEDSLGDSLSGDSRIIMYDPNAKDAINPIIYEVHDSADGRIVFYYADKSTTVSTSKSEMAVAVIVFDDGGSGILDVSIDGGRLNKSVQDNYLWYGRIGNIPHGNTVATCVIRVTDNANNSSQNTLTFNRNTPPVFQLVPEIPPVLCVDSLYQFNLVFYDQDYDPVTILWHSKPGSMDSSKGGILSWRPTASDTGSDSIEIQGYDGFSHSERFLSRFTVANCTQRYPVHFVTRVQDFPAVLQADHDTLLLGLKTDTLLPGLLYSARFLDRSQVIRQSDPSATILWTPVLADTGYRRLLVTVGTGSVVWDSITPVFQVVPKNEFPCSLSYRFTGKTTPAGELDLFSHPVAETLYFAIHDRDNPLTEKYRVSITRNTVNSVQVLDKRDFFIVITPDSTRSLDTLRVSVRDQTGTTDTAGCVVRYAGQRANRKPELLSGPSFQAWFCTDSSYRYSIVPFDSDNDVVDVETILKPAGMTVSLRGVVAWTPTAADTGEKSLTVRFFDGKDYSAGTYSWTVSVVNCATLPPGVKFRTTPADFPSVLMTDDSMGVPLSIVTGTGVAPFNYSARFIGNNLSVLTGGTDSLLVWKPSLADTGIHVLMISVADRYGRKDSIMPVITVVPRNLHPCSLSYVYSGAMVSPGVVEIRYPARPETFSFTIHDLDNPLTEGYTVDIVKDRIRSSQTLSGNTRGFTLTMSASTISTTDTVRVKIGDATGTSDSVVFVIKYLGIYERRLVLNTTAAGTAVMTNQINFPLLVRLDRNNFDFSRSAGHGGDVVFKKANGAILPHEIELWDSLAGKAAVWVKVDTVFGNDSVHAIMLNCNESVVSPSNPHDVFDTANGFCGVWHLDENPADGPLPMKDRSPLGNDGSTYGLMTAQDRVPGLIGNGVDFDGVNDYVSFGDVNQVDGVTKLTASAWIKPSGLQDWAAIIGKANDVVNEWEIIASGAGYGNNTNYQVAARNSGAFNTQCGYTTTNPISIGNWLFCVMVFDGTQPNNARRLKFYINGVQQTLTFSNDNIPDRLPATTWPVQIAKTPIGSGWFQGIMDEAIVARDARSADWVKLCYMNQRTVDALVKVR